MIKNHIAALYILCIMLITAACGSNSSAPLGSSGNPIIIPVDPQASYQSTPYDGTIGNERLYFKMTGLTVDNNHTVTLSNLSDNLDLYTYSDAFATLGSSCTQPGTADETCYQITTTNGELYLMIDGTVASSYPVTFHLVAGT